MRISNTMSASSTFSVSVASGSRGDAARANRRTQEPTLTNNRTIGPTMNKAKATKIIIAERKAILVHGEPLTRMTALGRPSWYVIQRSSNCAMIPTGE